jgi:hypothetical protein
MFHPFETRNCCNLQYDNAERERVERRGTRLEPRPSLIADEFRCRSCRKELLNIAQDLDKTVDFFPGIVKVKTRARGRFDTQFVHQGLIAVMPAAEGYAALVRESDHIVGMHIVQQKADQPRASC